LTTADVIVVVVVVFVVLRGRYEYSTVATVASYRYIHTHTVPYNTRETGAGGFPHLWSNESINY
jgi:hypothetical protein